jgi:prepilin-type N-terminal cleavage/methylation domain-containing protein
MKSYSKRRIRQQGFTMVEVVMSLIIFTVMALLTAAVVPISARSVRYGNDYTQAATLAMHKVNQLQEAGYANMNRNLNSLGVVDSNATLPTTTANASGAASGASTFTTKDNLATYFIGGASAPAGNLSVAPYTPSGVTVGGVTTYSIIQVTIEVRWRDARGRSQNYFTKTLISKNPIL